MRRVQDLNLQNRAGCSFIRGVSSTNTHDSPLFLRYAKCVINKKCDFLSIDPYTLHSCILNDVGIEIYTSELKPQFTAPEIFQPTDLHTFNPEYKLEGHDQIVDAFVPEVRKEIGRRDRWVCQGIPLLDGCYWTPINGKPARFQDGYMVQAAHYPEKQKYTGKGYHDKNPEHGRCLCTVCHALEEMNNGNRRGAELLVNNNSIYTYNHADETGEQLYLTIDELFNLYREKVEESDARRYQELLVELQAQTG